MRSVLACTLILSVVGITYAEPPADAKARASLALAKAKGQTIATAPAPRPAVLGYEDAKRISLERGVPVVVFVGCDPVRVSNTLVAVVPEMDGYETGTVIVCYPSAGILWADAKISCPAPAATIEAAVKVAGKKVEAKPTGKRLDWS